MEQKKIDRINEFVRIAKQRPLTKEEEAERKILRDEYIASFKASLVANLDNTYIVDEKGNKKKLKRK